MVVVVIVITVVLLVAWVAVNYRNLVSERQAADQSWSVIRTSLKRRHEVIPRVIDELKSDLKDSSDVVEDLAKTLDEARSREAASAGDRLLCESALSEALGRFFKRVEQSADVLERESYLKLREEVVAIEDQLMTEKAKYNLAAGTYNVQREVFPNSFIVPKAGLQPAPEFEIEDTFANYRLKYKGTLPTFTRGPRRAGADQEKDVGK